MTMVVAIVDVIPLDHGTPDNPTLHDRDDGNEAMDTIAREAGDPFDVGGPELPSSYSRERFKPCR